MKLIDLSATIQNSPEGTPPFLKTEIQYHDHQAGAMQAQAILQVPASVFRHEEGWATETITQLGTHNTTHIDAPYHYNSKIQEKPAQTVDELPLEWFFSDGVKLDMSHKGDGDVISVFDVQTELDRIGYKLKARDIVLMYTGRDQFYQSPNYLFMGCGVSAEATIWLYEQGVRVMGIDAWGWDAPLNMQAEQALIQQEKGVFWAAHQVDLPYVQIERLVNLAELPPHGFKVSCLPLKLKGASGSPVRAVAIL